MFVNFRKCSSLYNLELKNIHESGKCSQIAKEVPRNSIMFINFKFMNLKNVHEFKDLFIHQYSSATSVCE